MIYGTVTLPGRIITLEDAHWRVESDGSHPFPQTDQELAAYLEICFPWNVSPADGQPGVLLLERVAMALGGRADYPRPVTTGREDQGTVY